MEKITMIAGTGKFDEDTEFIIDRGNGEERVSISNLEIHTKALKDLVARDQERIKSNDQTVEHLKKALAEEMGAEKVRQEKDDKEKEAVKE